MAFAENRSVFLNLNHFGVVATWNGTDFPVIFDATYIDPLGVESASPVAFTDSANVSGAAHGQAFVVGGITYKIRGVQPDGTGFSLLKLEEQ